MSSDYDDDEDFLLNLDDEDFRKLSEVEDKCGIVVSQSKTAASNVLPSIPETSSRGGNPPPFKRTRTLSQSTSMTDDDTPDIFVNADGTYGLDSAGPSTTSRPPPVSVPPAAAKQRAPEPVSLRSVSHGASSSRMSVQNGNTFAARPLQRQDSRSSTQGLDTPMSTQGSRPLIRAGSLSQAISRGLSKNGMPASQQPPRVAPEPSTQYYGNPDLQKELEALRAQLAQVSRYDISSCYRPSPHVISNRPNLKEKVYGPLSRKIEKLAL